MSNALIIEYLEMVSTLRTNINKDFLIHPNIGKIETLGHQTYINDAKKAS